jgi:hypothetical protein
MEAPMKSDRRTMLAKGMLLVGFLALSAPPLVAQQGSDVRIAGAVEKCDGQVLVINGADGSRTSFALASSTVIIANQPSSLSAIKAGDFVASAAVKGVDGKLHSTELRIFPEALRGVGEGQRPMAQPNTMMTNASVSEVVAAPAGRVLKVKFKEGTSELIVGPEVPITALVVSDASVLKGGASVMVMATKAADGAMTAKRVLVR